MITLELTSVAVAVEDGELTNQNGEKVAGKLLLFQCQQSGIIVRCPLTEEASEAISNALRPSGVIIARQVPPGRGLPTSPLKA